MHVMDKFDWCAHTNGMNYMRYNVNGVDLVLVWLNVFWKTKDNEMIDWPKRKRNKTIPQIKCTHKWDLSIGLNELG